MRHTPLLRLSGVGGALLSSSSHPRTTLHMRANGEHLQVTQWCCGQKIGGTKTGLSLSATAQMDTKSPSCLSREVQPDFILCIQPYRSPYRLFAPSQRSQFSGSCSAVGSSQPLFTSVIVAAVIQITESQSVENSHPRTRSSAAQDKRMNRW